MLILSFAIRCVLTLAFLVGVVVGIRAISAGRAAASLCVVGCGILLLEQIGMFAFDLFALYANHQVLEVYQWASLLIYPVGTLSLLAAAIYGILPAAPTKQTERSTWSHGTRLLLSAVTSLAILPISLGIVVAMINTRETMVSTTFLALFTMPSIVTWLLASRYLESLRVESTPSEQRPVTLWAYGVASLSSLGAIFCFIFGFILLGLQRGWIIR
jgi:hypothetical protein